MITEKLFYKNPYQTEFTAKVLDCQQAKDLYHITLDKTCFYPEGGGQPGDKGSLGDVEIIDTHEKDAQVLHYAKKPLEIGATVTGKINWDYRFSLMQHHTAEHITSGIVNSLYKFNNVGFHMGSAAVTMDFDGELSLEDVEKIEILANKQVFENLPIIETHPTQQELKQLKYRSKIDIEGDVRIITAGKADVCACCGLHIGKTGEIGIIKLLSPQRYKGGTRVSLLCGEKAILDYRQKDKLVQGISQQLSAKAFEIDKAVERLQQEISTQKQEIERVTNKLLQLYCQEVAGQAGNICMFKEELSPKELGKLATLLTEQNQGVCIALCGNDSQGYRYGLGQKDADAREISKAMHQALAGKGGGSPSLVQGNITATKKEIEEYFSV